MRTEKQAQLVKNDKLLQASRDGCIDAVRAALESGADLRHKGGVFEETPLHAACAKGCLGVVKLLVESGADVRARCERNNTPLHEAAFSNHINVVKWMLANTTCRLLAKNINGMTPERSAKSQRHHKCADLLKKAAEARRLEKSLSPQRSKEPSPSPTKHNIDSELVEITHTWLSTIPPITTCSELHRQTDLLSKILPLLKNASSKMADTQTPCTQRELMAAMFSVPEDVITSVVAPDGGGDNEQKEEKEGNEELNEVKEEKEEKEVTPPPPDDEELKKDDDGLIDQPATPPSSQAATHQEVVPTTDVEESPAPVPPPPRPSDVGGDVGDKETDTRLGTPSGEVDAELDPSLSPPSQPVESAVEHQPPPPQQQPPPSQNEDEEEWECQHCNYSNEPSHDTCEVCEKPKGFVCSD